MASSSSSGDNLAGISNLSVSLKFLFKVNSMAPRVSLIPPQHTEYYCNGMWRWQSFESVTRVASSAGIAGYPTHLFPYLKFPSSNFNPSN